MIKKIKTKNLILPPLFFLYFFFSTSQAKLYKGDIDWQGEGPLKIVSSILSPDKKEVFPLRNSNHIAVQFFINKLGTKNKILPLELTIVSDGEKLITDGRPISFNNCQKRPSSSLKATIRLESPFFTVKQRRPYEIQLNLTCGHMNTFTFTHDGHSGQALNIFNIAKTATLKMKKNKTISFWKRKIDIIYPGRGDYYSRGTVHITKGHFWDVVGHELGHALYDMANIGVMEGGRHRIDQCYTKGLALSEGWASFFSAWISVGLNDPDAKFEYMVPRRAPLHFENIPSDVCQGEKNEWRVTGFLWDLIDLNEDQDDTLKISFRDFWEFTLNKRNF